ncbi:dihydroxyacetone kinase subunit DhaL [Neobacillus sp. OS1-32]|uniref:dihydroxyacetone kinase subunit DhaL n=1 Tax=Neobacillus sp. OS1-32 TaxID=3070682 RepID=UPI0027DFA72C|nr:dihydroxyacetone kinase subunit DhaL [Neobacillus sp. OS1-32]WML29384.1 dihydroxyacetone kinase subunit DhaL [Neobacillus sp. OS1-32]
MNQQNMKDWLILANERIQEQKDYLSELDRAIGDGDHGVNMARGFQEVSNKLATQEFTDIGAMLQQVAMTLIGKVGGASGPLYGTAFLKASAALKGKGECTNIDLANALNEALKGIKLRGKAEIGEKTMVDVWEPVVSKWLDNPEAGMDELIEFTHECMVETKAMEAKKGRAAYLGKRSIGTFDPGAVSSELLFSSLFTVLKGAAS